jgi:two-component system probable response regulator PhcQ
MNHESEIYDYQKYAILFVEDNPNTRKYFCQLFSHQFNIIEAKNNIQARDAFNQHGSRIGIIIADQSMPENDSGCFLSEITEAYPDVIKIISTHYSGVDATIGSLNENGVFRYMTKPWDIPQMEAALRRAMEFFIIKRERDALLERDATRFAEA